MAYLLTILLLIDYQLFNKFIDIVFHFNIRKYSGSAKKNKDCSVHWISLEYKVLKIPEITLRY